MKMIRTAWRLAIGRGDRIARHSPRPLPPRCVVVRAGQAARRRTGRVSRRPARSASRTGASHPSRPGARDRAAAAASIDWSAYTVLPGLIDLHTHLVGDISSADVAAPLSSSAARDALMGVAHARATLAAGFTTVRDVGTYRALVDVALRNAINAGQVEGPRMYVVRRLRDGHERRRRSHRPAGRRQVVPDEMRRGVADDEAEVRQRVREILAGGADFIKVIATGAVFAAGTTPVGAGVHRGRRSARRSRKPRSAAPSSRRTRTAPRASRTRCAPACAPSSTAPTSTTRASADAEARHLAGRRHLQRRLHRGSRHARRLVRRRSCARTARRRTSSAPISRRRCKRRRAHRLRHGFRHLPARRQRAPVRLHGATTA